MPQIGWLEILSVVIIAIFQKEVSSVTKDVNLEEEITSKNNKTEKNTDKNG